MNRALLGNWGVTVDESVFARAAAALGVLYDAHQRAGNATVSTHLREGTLLQALQWATRDKAGVSWRFPNRQELPRDWVLPEPSALAAAWETFRGQLHPGLRLMLDPSVLAAPPQGIGKAGLLRVLEVLTHPAVRANSVFVLWEAERRSTWAWPLRVGLLQESVSRQFAEKLARLDPANRLTRVFEFTRQESQCDLAVLFGSPRRSLARILASPPAERAAFVLFTGGSKGGTLRDFSQAELVSMELAASGYAVLVKPSPDPSALVNQLVIQLSHNLPLDVALFAAARHAEIDPPLLFLDPAFLERAQLSQVALGMARKMQSSAETPVEAPAQLSARLDLPAGRRMAASEVGRALAEAIPRFEFTGASSEATDLAGAHASLQSALATENATRRDSRYIQASVEQVGGQGPVPATHALVSGVPHCLSVRVAPRHPAWINPKNSVAFPDNLLPVDEEEHRLTVVLTEPNYFPDPLVSQITMRCTGSSSAALFEFELSPGRGEFCGRITISHRNRVLQTALLRARVLASGEAPGAQDEITLEVETLVHPILHDLGRRTRFDAALAFNHTPEGQPAMLGIADDHAVLRGLDTIGGKITAISNRLSEVGLRPGAYAKGLDGPAGVDLLRFLANKGHDLHDFLIVDQVDPVMAERLRTAECIQVVSLSPDAYFPAEFIYDFPVPADGAEICPKALEALRAQEYSHLCSDKDHDESPNPYVCPFGFWGLRRIIERHTARGMEPGDFVLQAEPSAARSVLEVNTTALFAASAHLDDEHGGAVANLFQALRGLFKVPLEQVTSWRDWMDLVRTHGPRLLMVLPHSEPKTNYGDTEYYLEIGTDLLKAGAIARPYVLKDEGAPTPLVVLLGCDTAVPLSAIDSFVGRFRRAGAAVVVATVASVLGSHAGAVARDIATELAGLRGGDGQSFGRLLLNVRRSAVARGNLMALCVGGFGDADWLIKS